MAKKEKEILENEAEMEADHAELRVYELGFHSDSELGVEEAKKVFDGIRAVIEKAGTLIALGEPVKVPLAYTVSRTEAGSRKDFDSAYFSWIAYETDGAGHEAVTAAARDESRIFRFLDIRTTKDAAKHSEEMHALMSKVPEPEHTEEEVSDVELDAALKEVV
ncbi:hypothetical protein L0Y34_02275 [Candidatus Parcubacteria bacterium]|nr:hypothetical protein [Candidatus Parcubacteria bacterium]